MQRSAEEKQTQLDMLLVEIERRRLVYYPDWQTRARERMAIVKLCVSAAQLCRALKLNAPSAHSLRATA
jgi:hypothetical protein